MKNPAVKRQIKLYITNNIKFWGTLTLCLIMFTFIWFLTIEVRKISFAIYMSSMVFILMLVIVNIPFSIVGLINILQFKKMIKYQEEKNNIIFDDCNLKRVQINTGAEFKKYIFFDENWFVIINSLSLLCFHYKDVKKITRKRINAAKGLRIFKYCITLKNNKVYKFRGNYKYYLKFKKWLDRENMVSK